ncbi:biotin transporter BioY [Nesterenkonia flava]|uniref:Biotin transporter n=1 Tax=Nesterenkonia flava TaxID=469799 RepID=A0ABU1FQ98_9MICC|nr:biotin transporter BioY [Nesterenkonia flava]MDR5710821.1 biotin transporter BioY [Nesterenkonia flava]
MVENPLKLAQAASVRPTGTTTAVTAISQMAIFAALVAVLGQVAALPIGPVPITLQTLGVMLAGAVLGPWRGAGSMLLLILLTAAGLPLMSQGSGGLGVFAGPTAGFILGWVPAAFIIGLVVQFGWPLRWWRTAAGVLLGGIPVIYACGLPVMMYQLGLSLQEALVANAAFLPGDAAKALFAILVTQSLAKAYPAPFTYARRGTARQFPAG